MEDWKGGGIPFGYYYDSKTKSLLVDPEESKILTNIFELILKGQGVNLIANYLNERKFFVRRTKRWTSTTISNMLSSNRLRFYRGFDDNGLLGSWSPLLNEEDYRSILTLREKKKIKKDPTKKSAKEKYLLSGISLLYCGYCGGRIKSSVTGSGASKKYYYYCSVRQTSGPALCRDAKLIPMKIVDDIVLSELKLILSPQSLNRIENNIILYKKDLLHQIKELTNLYTKELNETLLTNPSEAYPNYKLGVKKIQELWEDYLNISSPVNSTGLKEQELILKNVDKIILFNSKLHIKCKYPFEKEIKFD
ncbi:MAG: recombinase family protein [Melioribacteraceae bacterium]|nr:recombinase family protein [Melioribacteraceae bacterium]